MRRLTILVALALAATVAATEAAKPTSKPTAVKPTIAKTHTSAGGAVKPVTVKSSAAKPSIAKASMKGATAKAPTVMAASAKPSKPPKVTGTQAKATSPKAVKPAKTDAKAAKVNAAATKHDAKSTTVSTTSRTSTTGLTTPTTIDFTATALGQKLQKNSALRSKLEAKLQAAGYSGSVYEAAYGFKNLGQFNAATNQVQNQGYSFDLLKVLMTGTYVDPDTQTVYRANRLPDGTVTLVNSDTASNPASTLSLGQSKQAIAAGAEMPEITTVTATSSRTRKTGGSF